MAISSETSSASFAGNNSTSTAYTLAFPFAGASEIVVTHITAAGVRNTLAVTTGYTLHGDPAAGTGTLKTVAAIPVTDTLLVERFTAATQSLDSDSPAGSYPTGIEAQLDRTTRAIQDGKRIATRNFARSLRLPDGETAAELPAATLRKGEVLYFNATTGAIETKTPNEILLLSDGAPDGIGLPSGGTAGHFLKALGGGLGQWAALNQSEIQTAVSDVPGFRDHLVIQDELFLNEHRLHHFFKALFPFAASVDPAGSFVGIGGSLDSMGTDSGVLPHLTAEFTRRFGLGALASSTFSSANGPTESQFGGTSTSAPDYTGGAALVSSDFTYLPNGQYYSCPVGSTTTETVRDKSITVGFTRLRCFFGRRTGGGTITFTVTQNGTPLTAKTANTGTGTPGTIGYVDFVLADGLAAYGIPTLVTTHSTGTNHYLGSYLFLRSGFVPVRLGLGGSTIDQQASVPLANITDFAAATSLALLVHASKGDGPGDMAAHATRMASALPAVSHFFIGNSPSDSGLDEADSATMKAVAIANGYAFFDGYVALKDYALMTSLGWNSDTTHLSVEARQYQAGIILNRIFNRLDMVASSAALGSVRSAVGRHELVNDFLRNTARRANLSSTNQSSSAGSGWTVLKDRGSHDISWTTAPVSGNWAGTILLERHRMHGAFPMAARWQLMETANGAPQISAKIAFGYESGYPPATLDKAGLTWELGYDTATTPWIRFELHDGTGGSSVGRQVSPKFYLPLNTAAGNSGYVPGGTIWHNWALKYDGNGNSTSKRVRVWCSPSHPVNAASSPVKPVLVADWTFTVGTAAFLPSGTPFLSFAALCTGASPAASGSMQLQTFEVDHNFDTPSGIRPLTE